MGLGNVAAVFVFEIRRSLSPGRIIWWSALVAFPLVLTIAVRVINPDLREQAVWAIFLFALIPMLVAMLGTVMGAATAVSSELERRSWVYLASRPNGRTAMVIGKYLATVAWVLPATILAAVLCGLVTQAPQTGKLIAALIGIVTLACPTFAALYLAIGVLFPQRALVVSILYSILIEVVVSFIPAVVNQVTVHWRLRSLLYAWSGLDIPKEFTQDDPSAIVNILLLLVYCVVFVALAVFVVRRKEFSFAKESDS